jgi:SAM-dependent methyltransferase
MKTPNHLPLCHICGSEATFFLHKDGYHLYRCSVCALVFVSPLLSDKTLAEEVYSESSGYQRGKPDDLSQTVPDRKTRMILQRLGSGKGRTLLDVGCSNGEFMYHALCSNYAPHGVELNRRTADIAKRNGFPVFNGFLADAPYPKGTFKVAYLGDIIEHVTSPRVFLSQVISFLAPDGVLVISTPNLDCLWARVTVFMSRTFGIPCSSLTPPYHLHQFSRTNLDRILSDFNFRPVSSFYDVAPRLMYELGSLHLWGEWKRRKTVRNFLRMLFAFSSYTLAYAWYRVVRRFYGKDFAMIVMYSRHT